MGKVREIIFQLAGSASMCWKPIPKGVFDSSQASKFSEKALSELRKIIEDWWNVHYKDYCGDQCLNEMITNLLNEFK